jgi:hypothetical protein
VQVVQRGPEHGAPSARIIGTGMGIFLIGESSAAWKASALQPIDAVRSRV